MRLKRHKTFSKENQCELNSAPPLASVWLQRRRHVSTDSRVAVPTRVSPLPQLSAVKVMRVTVCAVLALRLAS